MRTTMYISGEIRDRLKLYSVKKKHKSMSETVGELLKKAEAQENDNFNTRF